jgi:hypothetical protein
VTVTRFKLVPAPPETLADVRRAWRAVPLVPADEADAVARLEARLDLPSRDVARTWLTFLRALELVVETPSGFRRRRGGGGADADPDPNPDPDPDALRATFLDRVFLAREALATLRAADGPVDPDGAFERLRDRVPTWEHHKDPAGWEATWRERVGALLDWLVLLELADRTSEGDGYRAVEGGPGADPAGRPGRDSGGGRVPGDSGRREHRG